MPKTKAQTALTHLSHPYLQNLETVETDQNEQYKKLPISVKYRVEALRKLHLAEIENDADFQQEIMNLENKYESKMIDLREKRRKIVNGSYEPSKNELLSYAAIQQASNGNENYVPTKTVAGVPKFWLTVLENNELSECWLEDSDKKLLGEHLLDIKLTYHNSENPSQDLTELQRQVSLQESCKNNNKGKGEPENNELATTIPNIDMFTLHFEFSPNNYFENKILTKTYYYQYIPNNDDFNPLNFSEPKIYKSTGCPITWKNNNMNLCYDFIAKKQKNEATGATRTIFKKEKKDSFFQFFEDVEQILYSDERFKSDRRENLMAEAMDKKASKMKGKKGKNKNKTTPNNIMPILSEEEIEEIDEQIENELEQLQVDFDLGNEFRESIVSKAVTMFTGEYRDPDADDEDDDDDSDDESGSGESTTDESDEDDENESQTGTIPEDSDEAGSTGADEKQKPECNNQ